MSLRVRMGALLTAAVLLISLVLASSKALGQQEKAYFPTTMDMVDDDGSMDTALLNYLFARQMVHRMRNNMDVSDLQRKRSYYKQCAFNAVSCFGKK